jgi:hypothetical protein
MQLKSFSWLRIWAAVTVGDVIIMQMVKTFITLDGTWRSVNFLTTAAIKLRGLDSVTLFVFMRSFSIKP